ncbi:Type 1 glutamine amidotransferase-like domain-containing protein [Oscillochloris sp. ZM17-4]|uniref:cyanophycinase n=1 Tax=Oscillochloris sp. ZM17-4 TaxID=2866714 RepID=UPI001C737129|nr:Type 1 glutamine amidotransferase-like domain-containing protein [Oscillochloris sp. ZM17-4]
MSAGAIILAGGAEFGGGMDQADRRAIQLAGGPAAPVRIIPAAAAPDHNDKRAGASGVRWFQRLGCADVVAAPLTDARSAADPAVVAELRAARLIYLLGGFPRHLGDSLAGSPAWAAIREALADGAVVGGSSAGAMVLCGRYFDPGRGELLDGLGLVPGVCVLPHHNTFGARWAPRLLAEAPALTLLGIDEYTAVVAEQSVARNTWRVYGPGAATVYRGGAAITYQDGGTFHL